MMSANLQDALRRACGEVGIVPRDVPVDGQWYATDVEGDRLGKGDGRIRLFPDGEGGIVCNWKGETKPFFVDDHRILTETERAERDRRRQETVRASEEEALRRRADAVTNAKRTWRESETCATGPSVSPAQEHQAARGPRF